MNQPAPMSRFPRTQQPVPVELFGAAVDAIAGLPEHDASSNVLSRLAIISKSPRLAEGTLCSSNHAQQGDSAARRRRSSTLSGRSRHAPQRCVEPA